MGDTVDALAFAIASRRIRRNSRRPSVQATEEADDEIQNRWIQQQHSLARCPVFLQVPPTLRAAASSWE